MHDTARAIAQEPPRRGEVWFVDLNPTLGHEQAGRRPVLIISANAYNASPAALVIALPLTSRMRGLPDRVPLPSPEGGLKVDSEILCGQVRAISLNRLLRRWGDVTPARLDAVGNTLRMLLQL